MPPMARVEQGGTAAPLVRQAMHGSHT